MAETSSAARVMSEGTVASPMMMWRFGSLEARAKMGWSLEGERMIAKAVFEGALVRAWM